LEEDGRMSILTENAAICNNMSAPADNQIKVLESPEDGELVAEQGPTNGNILTTQNRTAFYGASSGRWDVARLEKDLALGNWGHLAKEVP
jgi:hypothetical protein